MPADDTPPPHDKPQEPPQKPPVNPWGTPTPEKKPSDSSTQGNPFGRRGDNPKADNQGPARPQPRPQPQRPQPGAQPENEIDLLLKKLSGWWSANRPSGNSAGNNYTGMPTPKTLGIVVLLLAGVWLGSGFYRVQEGQLGVVLRFGQVNRTAPPGLRYHLPYPFETALTPNVTFENRIEVGFRSSDSDDTNVPEESVMLTADQNIIDLNFAVTWIVKDASQFLFEIRDPEITVKRAAESAMREVVGQTDIQSALTDARDQIQQDTKIQLQQILDDYKSGIEIVRVELLRVNPPASVVDAFNDVQRADTDRERLRNEAEGYRNKIIPEARGDAERIRNEAEGYKQQVINAATGEASRFTEVQAAYSGAKQVTAERLYLETMETVLRGKRKVMIDADKASMPYLPLNITGATTDVKEPAK